DVGTTATDVGDFTTLLLDINHTYAINGYPTVWTEHNLTVSGLASPVTGRLAFRYFVENGGPEGSNSDYIGVDTVSYNCGLFPTPTPSPTPCASCTPSPTPIPPTPTPSPCGSVVVFQTNFENGLPQQFSGAGALESVQGYAGLGH